VLQAAVAALQWTILKSQTGIIDSILRVAKESLTEFARYATLTDQLASAATESNGLTRESNGITQRATELTRQSLVLNHRPRLIVQNLASSIETREKDKFVQGRLNRNYSTNTRDTDFIQAEDLKEA